MQPSITVDLREWTKNAKALHETSTRSCVDFLNGQMLRLLSWTIYATKKASAARIVSTMNRVVNARGQTVAELLLFKYYARHKRWPVNGSNHRERVEGLIALKKRSTAMLRAGWLAAMNTYRRVVKFKEPSTRDTSRFGTANPRLGGGASPARFKLGVIAAEATNEAFGYVGAQKAWLGESNPSGAVAVATAGLQKAINRQSADMAATLAKRLAKDLKPFGAKA